MTNYFKRWLTARESFSVGRYLMEGFMHIHKDTPNNLSVFLTPPLIDFSLTFHVPIIFFPCCPSSPDLVFFIFHCLRFPFHSNCLCTCGEYNYICELEIQAKVDILYKRSTIIKKKLNENKKCVRFIYDGNMTWICTRRMHRLVVIYTTYWLHFFGNRFSFVIYNLSFFMS